MVWGKIRKQPGQNYTRRPYQRNLPSDMLQNEDLRHESRITTKDNFHSTQTSVSDAKDDSSQEKDVVFADQNCINNQQLQPQKITCSCTLQFQGRCKKTYPTVNVIINPQLLKFIPTLCPGWVNRLTCIITVYWHSVV